MRAAVDEVPATFVLKGGEVIALGVPPGPAVSRLLKAAEAQWLAEGLPDEGRQRAILEQVVADAQP